LTAQAYNIAIEKALPVALTTDRAIENETRLLTLISVKTL
jgi:hypothetical protein